MAYFSNTQCPSQYTLLQIAVLGILREFTLNTSKVHNFVLQDHSNHH